MVSAIGSALLVWCGPRDRPEARSSHRKPTATSGGVAIVLAATIGFALVAPKIVARADLAAVLLMWTVALAIGAIGALDDLIDLGARTKLLLGAVLAAIVAGCAGPVATLPVGFGLNLSLPSLVGMAGATLWLVTASNAVNFIDGADGLAPGAMLVAFLVLALGAAQVGDAPVAAASVAVAAGLIGFLPWNLRGRLFLGDVGALCLGFIFAALHLAAATRHDGPPLSLYFGPIALMPILADVLLTLGRRATTGRPLLQAHRQHLYQRWLAATGRTHTALAIRGWTLMLVAGAVALVAARLPSWQGVLLAAAAAVAAITWARLGDRLAELRPRA